MPNPTTSTDSVGFRLSVLGALLLCALTTIAIPVAITLSIGVLGVIGAMATLVGAEAAAGRWIGFFGALAFVIYSSFYVGKTFVRSIRAYVGNAYVEGSEFGIAFCPTTKRAAAIGAATGAGLAVTTLLVGLQEPEVIVGFSHVRMLDNPVFAYFAAMGGLLLLVMYAPIVEELVFRGALYATVRRKTDRLTAIFFVSTVFTLSHVQHIIAQSPFLVPIAIFSLIAAWLRIKFGSLVPSMAAHAAFNFVIWFQAWWWTHRLT